MLLRQNVASITCVDWSALVIDLWRHMDGSCPSRAIATKLGCPRHVRIPSVSDRTTDIAGGPVRGISGVRRGPERFPLLANGNRRRTTTECIEIPRVWPCHARADWLRATCPRLSNSSLNSPKPNFAAPPRSSPRRRQQPRRRGSQCGYAPACVRRKLWPGTSRVARWRRSKARRPAPAR
jgi:hypothetical protein